MYIRIILTSLIMILFIYSCVCIKSYEEFQGNSDTSISYVNNINNVIEKQQETIDAINKNQKEILDKLDFISEYKKVHSLAIDNKLKDIDNMNDPKLLAEELLSLNLQVLFKDYYDKLNDNKLVDLKKLKNALKTKYLIDNEIINVNIDDSIYEESNFDTEPFNLDNHTNEKYHKDKILPLINQNLEPNPSNLEIESEINKIKYNSDMLPDIIIFNDDDVESNSKKQIYLNDNGIKLFNIKIQEYILEKKNKANLQKNIRKDFENGAYIGDGTYFISREEYKKKFNL